MSDQANVTDFIKLLTSHEVRLRAFALSLVPHWADAQEILQDANVVMWRKFDQFQSGTSFFSWACKIVHLTTRDFRKRQARSKVRFSDEFLELVALQTVEMEDELADRELRLSVCVSKLKEKHRRMLHLRYELGMSGDEVAAALGSTAKAVYQALARIHKALFDCVERGLAAKGAAR